MLEREKKLAEEQMIEKIGRAIILAKKHQKTVRIYHAIDKNGEWLKSSFHNVYRYWMRFDPEALTEIEDSGMIVALTQIFVAYPAQVYKDLEHKPEKDFAVV